MKQAFTVLSTCTLLLLSSIVALSQATAYIPEDSSFGINAKAGTSSNAISVQADGKVITGGSTLARYTIAGFPDSSFNGNGIVSNPFGAFVGMINGIAMQTDGKIVIAGYIGTPAQPRFAVFRYKPNGSPDTTFGYNGLTVTTFSDKDVANCLIIQPNGFILAGGGAFGTSTGGKHRVALARYQPNGAPDNTFGQNGLLTSNLLSSSEYEVRGIALKSNGSFAIATDYNNGNDFTVAMFDGSGQLDTTFDHDGVVTTQVYVPPYGSICTSIAIQPDGKVVAAGTLNDNYKRFVVVRYNGNGTLDGTFNSSGKVLLGSQFCRAVKVMPDGNILLAGYGFTNTTGFYCSLYRLKSDGSAYAYGQSLGEKAYDVNFSSNRIYVTGSPGVVAFVNQGFSVPLKLTSFSAFLKNEQTFLNWQTTNEVNTSRFSIERSLDGRDFSSVGDIRASGNAFKASYNFTDDISSLNCEGCTLYYRLRMIDKDGSFTYSDVQKVKIPIETVRVIPNPARSAVRFVGANVKGVDFYDSKGQLVLKVSGGNGKSIDISALRRGVYNVVIYSSDKSSTQRQLILQ